MFNVYAYMYLTDGDTCLVSINFEMSLATVKMYVLLEIIKAHYFSSLLPSLTFYLKIFYFDYQ